MFFSVQQMHSNFKPSCQIDTRHIRVPQNKFKYTKYVGNKKVFKKILFQCVAQPDLSGVPLSLEQQYVKCKSIRSQRPLTGD